MQGLVQLAPLILMGAVFYFLIIRPQQARARAQAALLRSIVPGDRIVTIGGLHGTVVEADDDTLRLEATPGIVLTFSRQAVGRKVEPEDLALAAPEPVTGALADPEAGV